MIEEIISNPVMKELALKPYWTVNIDQKKPLDIIALDTQRIIRGAQNDACLTNLSELLRIVGVPQQLVYHLDAKRDGLVVLDIEKTCPNDIKSQLLKLPFIYGDISMSGLGYHLVLPCPILDEITSKKIVMREEHGYYEILLSHFVTFTDKPIQPLYTAENSPVSWQAVWDDLKERQRLASKKEIEVDPDDIDLDFPKHDLLKDAVVRNFRQRFMKTPDSYFGDMSRYEFAVIGSLRLSLIRMLDMPMFANLNLDIKQQILFIYEIASEIIEPRPKHEEIRDGKPWLLYQTYNSFVTKYDQKGE